MLTLAIRVFPDLDYKLITVIDKLGNKTWENGLVLTGNGLDHGITGNAYALHNIYRMYDR
jgi:hypothetical protein